MAAVPGSHRYSERDYLRCPVPGVLFCAVCGVPISPFPPRGSSLRPVGAIVDLDFLHFVFPFPLLSLEEVSTADVCRAWGEMGQEKREGY